jgi:hypothetical protein
LERVLERVPKQPKPAIEHAINVSMRGRIEALRRITWFAPRCASKLISKFAEEDLNKSIEMFERGRPLWARRRLQRYKELLNETEGAIERAERLGKNITRVVEHVCDMTYKHISVLERVLERVPEQAKPAIEHAINVSMRGHTKCLERLSKIINRTIEKRRRTCRSDDECIGLIYCPRPFGYEAFCDIPPNRTEGICHCLPKWKRVKINCTTDVDCEGLICPMVIGKDTPICKEGICVCGGRWERIWKGVSEKEMKEKIKEEIENKTLRRIGRMWEIYQEVHKEVRRR